jgi:hydrogenase maturation protein HypF
LEQLATDAPQANPYPFPFIDGELDFRPLLSAVVEDRLRGRDPAAIARGFQLGVAAGLHAAATRLSGIHGVKTIVLSGGVFQNGLLLRDFKTLMNDSYLNVWTNHAVPANDGGISLGQAALAAFGQFDAIDSAKTNVGGHGNA